MHGHQVWHVLMQSRTYQAQRCSSKSSNGHCAIGQEPTSGRPQSLEDRNQMNVYPHRTHKERQDRQSRCHPSGRVLNAQSA